MVVQHNLSAMNADRMLGATNSRRSRSMERLSSGYKINRAADDAAGLSISEKMRRQIRGLAQASNNAVDGVSCVQTAEGALSEVHDMLQRMGELAVKGASETLTTDDMDYITMEVKQLMSEIDRVQSTTTFNEQMLLDGTFQNKGLQVGAEAGQHIAITIGNMCTNDLIASALSKGIFYQTTDNNPRCQNFDAVIQGNPGPKDYVYQVPKDGLSTRAKRMYWDRGTALQNSAPGHTHLLAANDLTIFHSFSYNAITDEKVKERLTTNMADTTGGLEEDMQDFVPDSRFFQALNVFVKSAICDVSKTRSDLGAVQNRLEHTINNLDNVIENTTAAESAVRDTDISTEMVKYSNNNILAQAGNAMLAQANQSNQGVLALL